MEVVEGFSITQAAPLFEIFAFYRLEMEASSEGDE